MSKESHVEIPAESGNHYRYEYVDGQTVYRGPVGSAPEIDEEQFMMAFSSNLTEEKKKVLDEAWSVAEDVRAPSKPFVSEGRQYLTFPDYAHITRKDAEEWIKVLKSEIESGLDTPEDPEYHDMEILAIGEDYLLISEKWWATGEETRVWTD